MLTDNTINWHALYTKPRAEKVADSALRKNGFESYLPCTTTIKQWSDRKRKVIEPMFRSYLFVRTSSKLLYQAMKNPHIVYVVKFNNLPAIVRDEEIELIKKIETGFNNFEIIVNTPQKGEHVKIMDGPLKGITGILYESKNSNKVAIKIESLSCAIIVEIVGNKIAKI